MHASSSDLDREIEIYRLLLDHYGPQHWWPAEGAFEVIYSTMKASAPTHVTVESEGGILAVREVTGKMFFVAMSERRSPALVRAIDDVITKSKALLI